ncbi:MAG TPA: HAMP domain-containing sensor histidine kinase [Phycisphaerae bacterium]|nr:HAMP domain-containing sensor histidine kinase [Phycisphaerae bacterium]HOQ84532.1 HAMP domain-containing sensor histidine kinase [Phycisphaerae bacterium]HPU25917.1 HAMP domain-containing sensor histidine kinase [Phycisphaerae bacterium]HPZ98113.1 HAMP domain-containing sensor histidine kinase [Phycisphaerae bacterium]HQE28987.1 HAMP domain-containing sensor histidine kinase [Phycisphaerae bacterium]
MVWRQIFHVSLARKCQLLFGLAVALIITATLFVPGYWMEMFIHELNALRTRELAMLARARTNPTAADWGREQQLLDQWWQDNLKDLRLPADVRPRLIQLPPPADVTMPTIDAVLTLPVRPPKWLRNTAGILATLSKSSTTVRLATAGLHLIPLEYRNQAREQVRVMLPRARLMLRERLYYDPADTVLVKALREMQTDESMRWAESYTPGNPRLYRCILAVRGIKQGTGRRPLLGVIDVQRRVDTTSDVLLTRAIVVLAGLLAGFLAILVFYLISQRLILAPVRELKACAERISGGDLSARADLSTGDEFEELSDAFNNMLGQLERSRLELETINRSLDARLGEMAQTNVALYESNKLKSEFLANVSHELRTPLTSIIGFADLLRDSASGEGPVDKTRLARYAHNILTSGRGLLDIINDLLDLAKIEAGRIELHRSMFTLRDVCEALYDLTRPLFDKKNIEFHMELAEELPMMNSDAGKIRQILYNLLSNASKYTPEGGQVRFRAEPIDGGQQVRLAVTDTGPGIAPEHREQIFEKFRQLDSSVTREHSGTGLGLAITRELSMMLGGQIRLESEVGKGSTFIVELPVACPDAAARRMPALT